MGWLETIKDELVWMYANRAVWREIVVMLESKEEIPHRFWIRSWLTEHYGATQAMAIRRMVETNDGVISLGTLLRVRSWPAADRVKESRATSGTHSRQPHRDARTQMGPWGLRPPPGRPGTVLHFLIVAPRRATSHEGSLTLH